MTGFLLPAEGINSALLLCQRNPFVALCKAVWFFLVYSLRSPKLQTVLNNPGLVYTLHVACSELIAAKSSWGKLLMAASLRLAFRDKAGKFWHRQCAIEEEIITFICCTVLPELLFSRMAKPIATTVPDLLLFLWQTCPAFLQGLSGHPESPLGAWHGSFWY